MLPGCCPSCGYTGQIEGFLVEPEAKRAITRVAALDPAIGKVIGQYLRMFGTGKRGVQLRRAVTLIDELASLIETGDVCRDERVGVRRPATPAMWATGIERMLAEPPNGALQNHHYLRAVVFGLADQADAQAERQREADARAGRRSASPEAARVAADPLAEAKAYASQMVHYGTWTPEKAKEYVDKAARKLNGEPA